MGGSPPDLEGWARRGPDPGCVTFAAPPACALTRPAAVVIVVAWLAQVVGRSFEDRPHLVWGNDWPLASITSAATPTTCGAAMLVPRAQVQVPAARRDLGPRCRLLVLKTMSNTKQGNVIVRVAQDPSR